MGELGFNKVFGAILAAALMILGLKAISDGVFSSGGGHHGDHHESLNEWAENNFSYFVEMADSGGDDEVEEVYDLGLLLASADASAGERSFKGKCVTCHTIEQGGANGTGPNLFGLIGAPKEAVAGFGYSGALAATEGDWNYENIDTWLLAPAKYARGTSMAFAGLSRDGERANVIAYLASYSPDAPAAPAPLPAEAHEAGHEAEDQIEAHVETVTEAAEETVEAVAEDAVELGEAVEAEIVETVEEIVEPALND